MHQKLNALFSRFGGFVYENPKKILLLVAILLVFPLSQIYKIRLDTSTEGFFHPDDKVLLGYNNFRDNFNRDERIVIGIKSDNIFSEKFLNQLEDLHREIRNEVPYVRKVTSLLNVRNVRGEGDDLITRDLLKPFPKTKEEIKKIEEIVKKSRLYKNILISKDQKMTTIIVETETYSRIGDTTSVFGIEEEIAEGEDEPTVYLTNSEDAQIIHKIREVVEKHKTDNLQFYISGTPVINNALKDTMQRDMTMFMIATFILIFVFLYLLFKRASAVAYPLAVVMLSLMTTVGTMAYFGVAFKLPTQIVPPLILTVSIGATVHFLSIFFDKLNHHKEHFDRDFLHLKDEDFPKKIKIENNEEIICDFVANSRDELEKTCYHKNGVAKKAFVYAMSHSGLPIAMTSLTTAIGIGSFANSGVAPMSDFGVFASVGVMVSLFLTLTLLPALLSLTKFKVIKTDFMIDEPSRIDKFMEKLSLVPLKHGKKIIVGTILVLIVSFLSFSHVKLAHDYLTWFKKDNINRVATKMLDDTLGASATIELVMTTKDEENGWADSQKLKKLDNLVEKISNYKDEYAKVGKVLSLVDVIKETNRALHSNNEQYYSIPSDNQLISQEIFLFQNSGSDDLKDFATEDLLESRTTITIGWIDAIEGKGIVNYVKEEANKMFPDCEVKVTGMMPLLIHTFSKALDSSVESYIIAGILITIIMMFLLNSTKLGAISLIPNIVPILAGFIVMYLINMDLDLFTLMIGSIAIGLVVDDTIHFMHNFIQYYQETNDVKETIEKTFYTTGKAMVITTIVLSLGFFVYIIAEMTSIQNFGILTGSVIIFALLSDLILAPTVMIYCAKKGWLDKKIKKV